MPAYLSKSSKRPDCASRFAAEPRSTSVTTSLDGDAMPCNEFKRSMRFTASSGPTSATSRWNIGSVMYHDLSGGFAFDNGVKIRLGVDNLFDEQPPVSLTNLNINYDISTYDPVGRFMYAQLSWDFGG